MDPPVYKMRSILHSRNHEDQGSEGIDTTPLRGSHDRVPRLRLLNNDFYTDGPSTSTNFASDDLHQPKEDHPWHRICNYSSTLRPTSEISKIRPVFISKQICSEDRFVPKRNKYSLEAANYLLRKKAADTPEENEIDVLAQLDTLLTKSRRKCMHQAMVQENVIPGLSQKKVLRGCPLSMKNKLPGNLAGQPATTWDEKCDESAMWKSKPRKKPSIQIVDSILDMPGFQAPPTSRYHLIDWSSKNLIASAIQDFVTFYDANACASIESLDNVDISNVCTLKWNNAGDKLVICTLLSAIKLYNVEVQKIVWTTECKSETVFATPCYVRCLCWSHDDQHIVAGCRGLITIYSAETGRVVKSVLAHTTRVLALTFSSNYRYLASSASDSTVRIFLWPTLAPNLDITYIHPVKTLAWHPYQSGLLCIGGGMGDGSLSLWNVNELDVVRYRCVNFYAGVENLAWNKLSGELVVHWLYSDGHKRYTVMPVLANLDCIVDRLPVEKETRVNYIVWNHDHTQLAVQYSEFLSMWNFFGNEYQYRQKDRKRREVRESTGSMNFKAFGHFNIR